MASFVEELVDDMVTEGFATTKGTDIFYGSMPDVSASPTIAVYDTGGESSDGIPSPWLTVDVLVRDASWDGARKKQADIFNHYHDSTEISLTSYTIKAAIADGIPQSLGEDGARRHLSRVSYRFKVVADDQTGGGTTGYGGAKDPNSEIS